MNLESELEHWFGSLEQSPLGYVYLRLFVDAPQEVRNRLISRFGKATVFLPPKPRRGLTFEEVGGCNPACSRGDQQRPDELRHQT